MVFSGQQSAVRPSGFGRRRRPRHLETMEAQHGMATASVVARKQREQQEEEFAANRQEAQQSLALQEQQRRDAERNARRQRNVGYASTGVSLLNTIMSFF